MGRWFSESSCVAVRPLLDRSLLYVVPAASTTAPAPGPSMYCKLFSAHHCRSELESADVRTRPPCVPLIYIANCSHSYSGLHSGQCTEQSLICASCSQWDMSVMWLLRILSKYFIHESVEIYYKATSINSLNTSVGGPVVSSSLCLHRVIYWFDVIDIRCVIIIVIVIRCHC